MKIQTLIGLTIGVSLLTFSGVSAAVPNSNEGATCVVITEQLSLDSAGSQVVMLQKFLGFETFSLLGDSGYGYFGANTEGLLKDFQRTNGIPATGVVDASTREMIKKISCAPKPTGVINPTSGVVPPLKTPPIPATTQAFAATASYRGKVFDEQKNPLSGVVVELETQRLGFQSMYNNKHKVTTGVDGTYTFTGAQSSQVYQTLTFKKDGYILDKVTLTHGADLKQADFVLRKVGSSAVTYHWESSPTGILPSPRPPTCNPVPVVGSACTAQSSGCISGSNGFTCVMDTQVKTIYTWQKFSTTFPLPSPMPTPPPDCGNSIPTVGATCVSGSPACKVSKTNGYDSYVCAENKDKQASVSSTGMSAVDTSEAPSSSQGNFIMDAVDTIFGWFK